MIKLYQRCIVQKCFQIRTLKNVRYYGYTPPTKKTWSKQHFKIRIKRPLTDPFDARTLHPECEWWRRSNDAPQQSFMGFPDITLLPLKMGTAYIEKMDPFTLSIVMDKCVREKFHDQNVLHRLTIRTKNLINQITEPNLGFIFRSFAQLDWIDDDLIRSFLGRIERRLPFSQICDIGPILEAMSRPRFRDDRTLLIVLDHLTSMLKHRPDVTATDLTALSLGLLVLDERSKEIYNILKLFTSRLMGKVHRKLTASELTIALDCLKSLCPRNALPVIGYLSSFLISKHLNELEASGVVRLADSYFTAVSLKRKSGSNISRKTSSRLARLFPKHRRTSPRSKSRDASALDKSSSNVPLEIDAIADCSERLSKTQANLLVHQRETFRLCERIFNVSKFMTTSEVLRILGAIDEAYIFTERSKRIYSEIKVVLISQLGRSLAPDLMDVAPLDVARALNGLGRAGEIELLLTCVVPILRRAVTTYPTSAVVEIVVGSARALKKMLPEKKRILLQLMDASLVRLQSLQKNSRISCDDVLNILCAMVEENICDLFPHFITSAVQYLLEANFFLENGEHFLTFLNTINYPWTFKIEQPDSLKMIHTLIDVYLKEHSDIFSTLKLEFQEE